MLGPAMMVSRRVWSRHGGGLAEHLVARGHRVMTFDFRGHGDSGPPASRGVDWTYEDLVERDLPAVLAEARARFGGPVSWIGHSLGGHVAAAALGHGLVALDRLALLAANVWLPRWEPSRRRRAEKLAVLAGMRAVIGGVGKFPTRRLGLGSDDEARSYLGAFFRWWREDAWRSADGRTDHAASLSRVAVPVLQVTSQGDRLNCVPASGALFLDAFERAPRRLVEARRGTLPGGFAPDHMQLVTDTRSRPLWDEVAAFVEDV